jgi:hypothetical protein
VLRLISQELVESTEGDGTGSASCLGRPLVLQVLNHGFITRNIPCTCTAVYPKVSGLIQNGIYAYNNKHLWRSNTKVYGGKTH